MIKYTCDRCEKLVREIGQGQNIVPEGVLYIAEEAEAESCGNEIHLCKQCAFDAMCRIADAIEEGRVFDNTFTNNKEFRLLCTRFGYD